MKRQFLSETMHYKISATSPSGQQNHPPVLLVVEPSAPLQAGDLITAIQSGDSTLTYHSHTVMLTQLSSVSNIMIIKSSPRL